jgi:hypothetical protein
MRMKATTETARRTEAAAVELARRFSRQQLLEMQGTLELILAALDEIDRR